MQSTSKDAPQTPWIHSEAQLPGLALNDVPDTLPGKRLRGKRDLGATGHLGNGLSPYPGTAHNYLVSTLGKLVQFSSVTQSYPTLWNPMDFGHSFSSKEQVSFNFMAAVTICSEFRAQENKLCYCFPIYLSWSDGTRCHDLSFLNVEFLSQLFHSPISLPPRGSLVPLHFLP